MGKFGDPYSNDPQDEEVEPGADVESSEMPERDAVSGGANLRDGYRVLSNVKHNELHDGGREMTNVYGANEGQEKSDEDHTNYSDPRTKTGNKAKLKNGKGY